MEKSNFKQILSSINTLNEFENLKQNIEVLKNVAKEITYHYQLPEEPLTLFSEGTNIVFAYGDSKVIKIFPPFHLEHFKSELLVLKYLKGKLSIQTPTVEYDGTIFGWPYIVMTRLEGTLLETLWDTMDHNNKVIIIREIGSLIQNVHALPIDGLESIDCHWEQFIDTQINHCSDRHRSTMLPGFLLQQIPSYLESVKEILPKIKKPVLLTGEYTPMNFLVKQIAGIWHIDGLIDFGDSMLGLAEYDLLGPGAFLIQGDKQLLREFLISYGYSSEALTKTLSQQLTALMLLHKYSNLKIQVRIKDWESKVHSLAEVESLVWGF